MISLSEISVYFKNDLIRKSLESIAVSQSHDGLGIKRWDNVLKLYKFSDTVKRPFIAGFGTIYEPSYFVIEKIGTEELLFIKPVKGDSYRLGDVYGFFGFSQFKEYKGQPIILVEGLSDWGAIKPIYPYVLSSLTSGISSKQLYFLSNLTNHVITGFDNDEAGGLATKEASKKLNWVGLKHSIINPLSNDYGADYESEDLYSRSKDIILNKIKSISYGSE